MVIIINIITDRKRPLIIIGINPEVMIKFV